MELHKEIREAKLLPFLPGFLGIPRRRWYRWINNPNLIPDGTFDRIEQWVKEKIEERKNNAAEIKQTTRRITKAIRANLVA